MKPGLAFLLLLPLAMSCSAGPRPPSVLIVTLDTTRADRLGSYGRSGAGTPNLDALAARGVRFARAYTTTPLTLPSHASIFTGTYPVHHGVRDNGSYRLDERITTLAELLREAGYRTGAFVASYPLLSEFGLDQGFELYDDDLAAQQPARRFAYAERPAERVVAAATGWLDGLRADERFFAWVHVFDPHAMYRPPEPFASTFRQDPYQGEIAYVDHALGKLFTWLERAGRTDETLVVVVADHGESLGEHGEDTHSALIYDATMRVPLIVAGHGAPAGKVVEDVVRVVDILPTVAKACGIAVPDAVQGLAVDNLWRGEMEPEPREAYLESLWPRLQYGWSELRGMVLGDWKLIEAPEAPGAPPELYRLTDDPGENNDLAAVEPVRAARTSEYLGHWLAAATPDRPFEAARTTTAEDERQLGALGYLGGGPRSADAGRAHPRDRVEVLRGYVGVANLIESGRFVEALDVLQRLEAIDGGRVGIHERRGTIYKELGRQEPAYFGLAVEEFRKALALNGQRPGIWTQLAEVHRLRGELEEALRCYDRASAIVPAGPDVELNYAGVLAATGRVPEAIARYEDLFRRHPELLRAHPELARLPEALKRQG